MIYVDARSTYRHTMKTMGLLADGDASWPQVSWNQPHFFTFPIVTSRISLCSAAKVVHSLPVIYQSLKMAIHISCHLGTFASVTFILKHSSEKNLHREV
ncbi:hypothetical protein PSTT_15793 [Puccinia striiformis]|uniref:Uncharacterized protein n=1 Tax=Puccinia striiformis TaxID=27350 RepID=A0A2S4UFU3_9BASI|nr:hypothetical protein PSTT_15793 [Puccinia striiformis]